MWRHQIWSCEMWRLEMWRCLTSEKMSDVKLWVVRCEDVRWTCQLRRCEMCRPLMGKRLSYVHWSSGSFLLLISAWELYGIHQISHWSFSFCGFSSSTRVPLVLPPGMGGRVVARQVLVGRPLLTRWGTVVPIGWPSSLSEPENKRRLEVNDCD